MNIFDRYILKNLFIATFMIAVVLAAIILLTQSLKFLELVIESGASSGAFWVLTLLALPRFFEILLPLALMAGTIFIYNRMAGDSELVAIRAAGYSPFKLAEPALILSLAVMILLWCVTFWAAPQSLAGMQNLRQVIKAEFSALLFREGVFNQAGKGLVVYIRERDEDGEMRGVMIHDSRPELEIPSTVMARRGQIVRQDDGFQVLVYDGSRQEFDLQKNVLNRLNFDRYTIDLPDKGPVRMRWKEPEERTIGELFNPDLRDVRDQKHQHAFRVEIHRRIAAPLLAPVFTLISCAALLLGPVRRRGQTRRILFAVASVTLIQGLFLGLFNLSKETVLALPFMYLIMLVPMACAVFLLTTPSENFRSGFLYGRKGAS
ncbi:MAG: LPS export ABC transporter permease LptF [Alphaproteobacteria bacterium]